ncbi:MAG: DEAD/DEAH box helicase [Paraprevotella sp.]|nr:DEAD/DEAH box helicase [Paraprevotella sp.]
MDFYELDLSDDVLDALDDMNFVDCTPIQEHAIPAILDGRDVIGVAQTGTGKTAAFLLPILSRLSDGGFPERSIKCLVMSPTRELAQQIDQAMEGFSYYMNVSSVAVYGGNDGIRYEQEKRGLAMGADVVIATPGRLISHLSLGNIDLSKVSFFVLDEADRMLDMGFYDDIMQIVKHLPQHRQTIMFSATMPTKIQQLAASILNNPFEIKLAVSRPADKIVQSAYICYEQQKMGIIKHLFSLKAPQRVIVFASSKLKVKDLAIVLRRSGYNVGAMHSDLQQAERDEVMYKFKAQQIDVLVATDIVARGIDIDDIQLVINYDVPHDAEDYVHRIGRTARANNEGEAVTFVGEMEQIGFAAIERFLEIEIEKKSIPEELGEAPLYDPKKNTSNHKKRRNNKRTNYKSKSSNIQHKKGDNKRFHRQNKKKE